MTLFVNVFADNLALLEQTPQGDCSFRVEVADGDLVVLEALVALDDLDLSCALGQLFLAGARSGTTAGGFADSAASCEEEATLTHLRRG